MSHLRTAFELGVKLASDDFVVESRRVIPESEVPTEFVERAKQMERMGPLPPLINVPKPPSRLARFGNTMRKLLRVK